MALTVCARRDASHAELAARLVTDGFVCWPGFLAAEQAQQLGDEAFGAWEAQRFRAAGVGAQHSVRNEVRRDSILWLEPDSLTPAQSQCLRSLETLRLEINRAAHLGLFDLEAHLAVYPAGAYYRRHRDRLAGDDARVVSCVLYLNQAWCAEHGGALRLYMTDPAQGEFIDILPLAGTLVVFISAQFEHEVLPATRPRLSLAGWYRQRA